MSKMSFSMALDNLCRNYGKYMTRQEYSNLLKSGIDRGLTVKGAYNGIKMVIASETGQREYFTVDDVCEITGESRETVLERIEEMKKELISRGENPNKHFIPITPDNTFKCYFTL